MDYAEGRLGRIFVMRLHDGEPVPDVVESFAEEKAIGAAFCVMVGGVRGGGEVVVGPRDDNCLPPIPITHFLSGVHEVCGVGTIFRNEEGKPRLHMHASFGRAGRAVAGCTRLGVDIWQTGEIVIIEIVDVTALRKRDAKMGFELLEVS